MILFFIFLKFIFASERPNVILLLADDLGIGDISVTNKLGKIKTPNIDRLANEGVNFLDAHSASSRCAPSRFMLMTGRYSLGLNTKDKRNRVLPEGAPHIGEMFKKAGYRTGILGKAQPLMEDFGDDLTLAQRADRAQKQKDYQSTWGKGTGIKSPEDIRKSFYTPANYTMRKGAHTQKYDYSLVNNDPCCRVGGGYFENGISTAPFTEYAFQRPYPEGSTLDDQKCATTFTGETRCTDRKFAKGYIGPPHSKEPIPGPILVPKYPSYMLVQEDYDSNMIEQKLKDGAFKFIRESAQQEDPFFLYYATRAGHNPFNSAPQYRGKSDAGLIGEAVMELDDIVGELLEELKSHNMEQNTLIVFMSDNGAINDIHDAKSAVKLDGTGDYMWDLYRHYQNSLDFQGQNYKLKQGKASCYEGGHRVPFLWHYPGGLAPKIIDDSTVSYMDVYKTMADLIGADLHCNEAPDSRSLLPLLTGEVDTISSPIIHHCIYQGGAAIRDHEWKLIPGSRELYNLRYDLEEQNNMFDEKPIKVADLQMKFDKITTEVTNRENLSNQGVVKDVCF